MELAQEANSALTHEIFKILVKILRCIVHVYSTFTVQFLSTNKLGDLRSQCTIGGLRQCR